MILGIGLDLIELDRVAFVASRLACKEAAFKALGTGWGMGVTWRQVEVRGTASGAPQLRFHGAARDHLAGRGMTRAHVTLTHTRAHASAVVVLEG